MKVTSEINIEPMTGKDRDKVIALWDTAAGVRFLEAEGTKSLETLLNEQPARSFVAREGDTIVGAVCGGVVGAVGIVRHLAVLETHRRKGIGRALMHRCEECLRAAGASRIAVFVVRSNDSAREFWSGDGWSLNESYVCLEKSLYPELKKARDEGLQEKG